MKKQKRIPLKYGSARVDEDCSQTTIDMLNKICELAYEMPTKKLKQPDVVGSLQPIQEQVPCNNCQGCGCTGCGGSGYWLQ
jgi:hypothetical protein